MTDQRCLGRSRWILAIRSKLGEVELISRTPQLVKLCSKAVVPQLVKRALPRMDLTHLPTPPACHSSQNRLSIFQREQGRPLLGITSSVRA